MPVQETASVFSHGFNYFISDYSGLLIIKILDIEGKIAKTIKETVTEDIFKLSVNVDDLKKGNYIMNIFNDCGFVKSIRYTKN